MFEFFNNKNKGFTLIELLVVIAIIGLLSSVAMASLNSARIKARNASRISSLRELKKSLEMYFNDNNKYPSSGGAAYAEGRCDPAPFGWMRKPDYSGSDAYIPGLAPQYIPILPGDPAVSSTGRCYVYWSDGSYYTIMDHFGVEGDYDVNDPILKPILRLLGPDCRSAQNTYVIKSENGPCDVVI